MLLSFLHISGIEITCSLSFSPPFPDIAPIAGTNDVNFQTRPDRSFLHFHLVVISSSFDEFCSLIDFDFHSLNHLSVLLNLKFMGL